MYHIPIKYLLKNQQRFNFWFTEKSIFYFKTTLFQSNRVNYPTGQESPFKKVLCKVHFRISGWQPVYDMTLSLTRTIFDHFLWIQLDIHVKMYLTFSLENSGLWVKYQLFEENICVSLIIINIDIGMVKCLAPAHYMSICLINHF